MKTDTLASPAVVTSYHYDVAAGNSPETYGSWNNRLMWFETVQGESVLEKTWYAYNGAGHVRTQVTQYPQSAKPDTYHITCFHYTAGQNLWLLRKFTGKTLPASEDLDPESVEPVLAREFRYDGNRQRYMERDRDAVTLVPISGSARWHDYVGNLVAKDYEVDADTGDAFPTTRYVHGLGLAAMQGGPGVPPGDWRYFHADMLGTTRLITGGGGFQPANLAYTAFGEVLPLPAYGSPAGSGGGGAETRYGYCGAWGYQNDGLSDAAADIGLLHVGARYYDPRLGRFVMRDPIGLAGGLNTYAYARNSPTVGVDPTGNELNLVGVTMAAAIGATLGAVTTQTVSGAAIGAIAGLTGGVFGAYVAGASGSMMWGGAVGGAMTGFVGSALSTYASYSPNPVAVISISTLAGGLLGLGGAAYAVSNNVGDDMIAYMLDGLFGIEAGLASGVVEWMCSLSR